MLNSLGINPVSDHGLSFELTVDGRPLAGHLQDGNGAIPYWIVSDGIPTWPPSGPTANPHPLLVTVCPCGEYGCGHTRCQLEIGEGIVRFYGFAGDVGARAGGVEFRFPEAQYRAVCEQMARMSAGYRACHE